jgi:signal transduction histidine kinase
MSDTAGTPPPVFGGRSVFAKLVAILMAMATSLLVMVTGSFWLAITPTVNADMERVVGEYAELAAARGLDHETAAGIRERLHLYVRYEGPAGAWTTARGLPSIDAVRRSRDENTGLLQVYYLVPARDGGEYLFAWFPGRRLHDAHVYLLLLLLALMIGVVLTTHAVLRRLLRPLRPLGDGVARLTAGELDVVLPNPTRDEFGVLTGAFNRMAARVAEMIRARDRLLQDVSHELRSPLTRLKVALELLPATTGGEHPRRMAADVAEMEAMITELLELERLRDGRGLDLAPEDLLAIVEEAAAGFRDRAPGVIVAAGAPRIRLDADRDKLRTVLRNLLENAVKHSFPDSRPIEISLAREGDAVLLRVRDDGPGIPQEALDTIFEPFFRLDRSRSKKTGGYGLGLSICKRIVEAHGGTIRAENHPGGGASFVVTLPAR